MVVTPGVTITARASRRPHTRDRAGRVAAAPTPTGSGARASATCPAAADSTNTGVEDEARLLEAFDAGIDDCVVKPVNPRVLLARLKAGERVVTLQNEVESDREEIRRFAADLATTNRRLQEAALLDSLTSLPNRRYMDDRLAKEFGAARHSGTPLSCMVVDADHFKRVNDTHGHQVGDQVLRAIARVLRGMILADWVVARLGGEEFIVICPGGDTGCATKVGEQIRSAVEAESVTCETGVVRVTASVGVASLDASMPNVDALLRAADDAAYQAKAQGRNVVVVHQSKAGE